MATGAEPVQSGPVLAPGTMLGKYELLSTIGQGGMASVILARQRGPGGFEKVVVIKVVHPHLAQDRAAVQMLLDEARVAAQIDHPNVVQTYELGEAHGTFYIVMEYLAGESFNSLLRRAARVGALDPSIAAWVLARAAEGLHAAHELRDFAGNPVGVVHRDVSPGNILVLYNGNVKVVDFGIAKAQGRVTSTQDGQLKGKYGYMSPEQIRNEPLDRRADVFSLGVVLWEALALQRLFYADNVAATLMQVLSAERVPPSRFRAGISRDLDAIALRALAVDPQARFQSAAEMKQALDNAIWQARCGPGTVEAYMRSIFAERIDERRALLARATREALTERELASLGAALKDGQETGKSSISGVAPRRSSRWRGAAIAAPIALATGVGVAWLTRSSDDRRPAPAPAGEHAGPPAGEVAPGAAADGVAASAPPGASAGHAVATGAATGAGPVAPTAAAVEGTTVSREHPALDNEPQPAAAPAARHRGAAPAAAKPRGTTPAVASLTRKGTDAYIAGRFAEAEAAFGQALALDRDYAAAHKGLGFVYERTNSAAKAIKSLKRYLQLKPGAKDAPAIRDRIKRLGG